MIRPAVAALLILAAPVTAQSVPEPDGYRMDRFRAPVPSSLTGGTVIGPEEAHDLWKSGQAAFVDVLPQAPKPKNLPKGTIWRDKPRHTIPGAIWLPNVGYGAIHETTAAYFRDGLQSSTNARTDHPVVFFCLEDCWMSWNAAKRAIEWGYTAVYWLPEGTDGWQLWDYPLERVEPQPLPPEAQ